MTRVVSSYKSLDTLSATYAAEVLRLHNSIAQKQHVSEHDIFACLRYRDRIAIFLLQELPTETDISQISAGDQYINELTKALASSAQLVTYYRSFPPDAAAWWWPKQVVEQILPRTLHQVIVGIIMFFFAVVVMLLGNDLLQRFYGQVPAIFTNFTATSATLVSFLAWLDISNPIDKSKMHQAITILPFARFTWFKFALFLMLPIFIVELLLCASSPFWSERAYKKGFAAHERGALSEAQEAYERALRLNPDFVLAHYQLGVLFEDTNELDKAKQHYIASTSGQSQGRTATNADLAFNNLGRIYILERHPDRAVSILLDGIKVVKAALPSISLQDTATLTDTLVTLHSNLAWARLEQGKLDKNPARFAEALAQVEIAKKLAKSQKSLFTGKALCVFAETKQQQQVGAPLFWRACLVQIGNELAQPDTDYWLGLAGKNLPVP